MFFWCSGIQKSGFNKSNFFKICVFAKEHIPRSFFFSFFLLLYSYTTLQTNRRWARRKGVELLTYCYLGNSLKCYSSFLAFFVFPYPRSRLRTFSLTPESVDVARLFDKFSIIFAWWHSQGQFDLFIFSLAESVVPNALQNKSRKTKVSLF